MAMGWWGHWSALLAALFAVAACDPGGRAYEDVRLARLKVGESTEQDVVRVFGAPAAVRSLPTGKGLVYPLGPEGAHTLLIRLDAAGLYVGRENLLTRDNFARIGTGMTDADVTALLGPPGRVQPLPLKQQTTWEWRFLDGQETRVFVVAFDAAGRVVSTAIEEDPRRHGGG